MDFFEGFFSIVSSASALVVSSAFVSVCTVNFCPQDYSKITQPISMKFCTGVGHDPSEDLLNIRVDPDKPADPRIFLAISLTW